MRRGQTLVIFAFTLLALTVMVMITIGLGVRIHEKQEQQIVADAAAYSQAVVTARTFNTMAVMNRTMIAQLATVTAAQSILSFGGFYHGVLNQARDVLAAEMGGCATACEQAICAAHARVEEEDRKLIDKWEPAGGGYSGSGGHDKDSGRYVRRVLYQTALEIAEDQKKVYEHLTSLVAPEGTAGMAEAIAAKARAGSPWASQQRELYAGAQKVTLEERNAAVLPKQQNPTHMARAMMGTRGLESFLSSREGKAGAWSGDQYISARLNAVIGGGPELTANLRAYGTSYFGDSGPQERSGFYGEIDPTPNWHRFWQVATHDNLQYTGAWAQDYGRFWFTGNCIVNAGEDSFGYIHSNGPARDDDNHMWARGIPTVGDYREWNDHRVADPPHVRHTFDQKVPDADNDFTIWPVFVDYEEGQLGAGGRFNVDGQPKSVVPILRDYSVRNSEDPWELDFRFDFASATAEVDLRNERREALLHSVAIGTGLTYYHRGDPGGRFGGGAGHAREPPNFLNPFWRATLVAGDIDERYNQRGNHILETLDDVGRSEQRSALTQLRSAGFEAIP